MGICGLEEAKEILENVIADEVIGTYCIEIQKTTECAKNCEKEDCFLQQAIDTVIAELYAMQNLLDEKREELEHLQKENEELRENSSLDEAIIRADAMLDMDKIWRNKIREKIEKEKTALETCYGRIKYQEGKIEGLQDLLKEE